MKTLGLITLIWIFIVDTFNFLLNPLFFCLLSSCKILTNESYPLNGAKKIKFPGFLLAVQYSACATILIEFYLLFWIQIKWNGSVYTGQLMCPMRIGLFKSLLKSKSRLPISEFSVRVNSEIVFNKKEFIKTLKS